MALRLKPVVEKKAEARMKLGKSDPTQKSAEGKKGESRDELAAIAGISHDTLKRAEVPSNLRPAAIFHLIG